MSSENDDTLLEAVKDGDYRRVMALLDAGADRDASDTQNRTGAYWAARYGYIDICRLLRRRGADVELPTNEGQTPFLGSTHAYTSASRTIT